MFSNLLVKTFIKDNENIENEDVRNKYGYLAGMVGIIANFILFGVKLSVGLLTSSIAIMADAFNNLSDMASSVITIVGFKLASIPPDKEHPFGHGRLEYISALIVAFMVMLVGIQFVKSSIDRILNPVPITFEIIPFILLFISILVKVWLSRFNKFMGSKINSSALKAASVDAMGDVFTSSTVLISFLAAKFTSIPIDGYAGIIVSVAILYAGYSLVKETISPLLGEAPDPELVQGISQAILSYEHIQGVHDLIIHNYGVGKSIASVHAEIPADGLRCRTPYERPSEQVCQRKQPQPEAAQRLYRQVHQRICKKERYLCGARQESHILCQRNPQHHRRHCKDSQRALQQSREKITAKRFATNRFF